MELSVYNIKGEDTGKKVVLDDAVFVSNPMITPYISM